MHKSQRPPLIHDQVAQLYDRARPGYPAALFDDIIYYAALPAGARILEVGCGTGQATLPLAQRGYAIDCLEPGAQMAAIARANLANFPNVTVHPYRLRALFPPARQLRSAALRHRLPLGRSQDSLPQSP